MVHRSAMRVLAVVAITAGLGAAGCSDDSGATGSATTFGDAATTTSASSTTTSAPTSASTTGVGCAKAEHAPVPAGVASRAFGDVDGDGQPDTLYVSVDQSSGARRFGVRTASGVRSEWAVGNASPVAPGILGTADANQDGQVEIFVNPGRVVDVLTYRDCTLQPYLNKQGEPYGFSVGFDDAGTGMGCTDADGDGKRDLVGLEVGEREGDQVPWTRTIVTLQGDQARNGATSSGTFTSPKDDEAIALLSRITCGEDSFSDPLTADG
jgi:hypothetical protein